MLRARLTRTLVCRLLENRWERYRINLTDFQVDGKFMPIMSAISLKSRRARRFPTLIEDGRRYPIA